MTRNDPGRRSPDTAEASGASPRGIIRDVTTGVPGLDTVLGGGLPEYSFNLIAGGPGAGKTTLAQQIAFAAATAERPALYFTVLGEPTLKMLRYMREYSFFDRSRVGTAIQYLNLSEEALTQDLGTVLDRLVAEVERANPAIVVVDSFRSFSDAVAPAAGTGSLSQFVQRLALHLTTWEVTSFLIGEYSDREQSHPVFTVADGVLWLSQVTDRNSVVRKLQAMKIRGRALMPGLHTFRITRRGLQVFPRIPEQQSQRRPQEPERLGTGVPGLDDLMGGGIPAGDALMLGGPAGSGKTTFATQFISEGLRRGESAVIAVFEEYPEEYLARAATRDQHLAEMQASGKLEVIYMRPLDLSVDETLAEIRDAVVRVGATRVVIDSLSGFEVALAPTFREDFRESLYRLVGALTATGVTVFMTAEIAGGYPDFQFTTERVSFITDDIVIQRFVEIDGQLRTVLSIVKMRGSDHSHDFWLYRIASRGGVIGQTLQNYRGILTGVPRLEPRLARTGYVGLNDVEASVLDTLVRAGASKSDVLAGRLGLPLPQLEQALQRLVELGYAGRTDPHGTTYCAIAQVSG